MSYINILGGIITKPGETLEDTTKIHVWLKFKVFSIQELIVYSREE